MIRRVAVLGGGVAGLTAADELSRRGYEVDLYDADPDDLGGKARSYRYRGSAGDLPAEHGFRLFPGFYRNVFETMAGIPSRAGEGTVADRLVTVDELALWSGTSAPHHRVLRWGSFGATQIGQLQRAVDQLLNGDRPDDQPGRYGVLDVAYLAHLLGVVALADRHKLLELEGHTFAEYTCRVFAERSVLQPSARLEAFLTGAGTRLLVAAEPDRMSARTGLVTLLRLLNPLELYTERGDRLLPGPTNEEWIDPWVADLGERSAHRPCAVAFQRGRRVAGIELDGDRAVAFTTADGARVADFDHLVCALPHAALRACLGDALPDRLAGLAHLTDGWMVGVQYYLRDHVQLGRGCSVHLDSPWALTSLQQGSYWPGDRLPPPVCDVLSVCVSDWETPSPVLRKAAAACTRDELLAEVWRQLCEGVNRSGASVLPADRRAVVEDEHVDGAIAFDDAGRPVGVNVAPLFANVVGSWAHRPDADPGFANLFLAGDYVRTNADLASMESANEAARRAVQAVLDADGHEGEAVKVTSVDHLGLLEE